MQEVARCSETALSLEQQSVWKANELRLAKAREQLLLAQLQTAEEAAEQAHAQVWLADSCPGAFVRPAAPH